MPNKSFLPLQRFRQRTFGCENRITRSENSSLVLQQKVRITNSKPKRWELKKTLLFPPPEQNGVAKKNCGLSGYRHRTTTTTPWMSITTTSAVPMTQIHPQKQIPKQISRTGRRAWTATCITTLTSAGAAWRTPTSLDPSVTCTIRC